ncbi:conserved protein of unknown function [Ectopseudomonas oleovorans]|uniref:Uncharacterized protein n=1 Tax=Ectopseudomonas oleovorans TaxID=301 RepID=A0A653BBJ4_ECTOL|nr:conserved protein of unknown function [Pseudomonas oleovorans]
MGHGLNLVDASLRRDCGGARGVVRFVQAPQPRLHPMPFPFSELCGLAQRVHLYAQSAQGRPRGTADAPGINPGTFHFSAFKDRIKILTACFCICFQ